MSEIILYPPKSKEEEKRILKSLPKDIQARAKIVQYPFNPYECWKTWKKYKDYFPIQSFLFVEKSSKIDPSAIVVFVINIENTFNIFKKHYEYFKTLYGKDFDPNSEIFSLETDSSFWKCVFKDHTAQGLLFGYGEKNAKLFAQAMREKKIYDDFDLSTKQKIDPFKATKHHFTIPLFRSLEDEEMIQIYKKEQKKIKKIFRGKDILDVTLKKLSGESPD